MIVALKGEKYPSISLVIYVTEKCNLACKYCFVKQEPKDMTDDVLNALVKFGIERSKKVGAKNLSINFFGGEPLLRTDLIKKMINIRNEFNQKSKNLKIHLGITTNGTLLNKENVDMLSENKIGVLLSIDGNRKAQNTNRIYHDGHGSFDDVIKNVDYLLKKIPNVTARMTITTETIGEYYNSIKFLYEKGFRHFAPIIVQESDWDKEKLNILEQEMMKIMKFYLDKFKNGENIYIKFINDFFKHLNNYHNKPCGAGRGLLAISPEGDIYPCQEFYEYDKWKKKYLIGNVFEGIKNENIMKLFNAFDIEKTKYRNWFVWSHASIGCPAHNYGITGNPFEIIDNFKKIKEMEVLAGYWILKEMLKFDKGIKYVNKYIKKPSKKKKVPLFLEIPKNNIIRLKIDELNKKTIKNDDVILFELSNNDIINKQRTRTAIKNFLKSHENKFIQLPKCIGISGGILDKRIKYIYYDKCKLCPFKLRKMCPGVPTYF